MRPLSVFRDPHVDRCRSSRWPEQAGTVVPACGDAIPAPRRGGTISDWSTRAGRDALIIACACRVQAIKT